MSQLPSHGGNDFRDVPRDRVTGVPASSRAGGRITEGSELDYLEQEIRRTRAGMSATLNQLEHRLSPAHIKHEIKHSISETIADVREEYNPKRIAKQAGDTMLDTIKDHPLAAMAAGLSVGYLAMKGAEESRDSRSYNRTSRRRAGYDEFYGNAAAYPGGPRYAEFSVPSPDRYYGERFDDEMEYGRDWDDETGERSDNMRSRMREGTEHVREGAEHLRDRAEHLAHESAHTARELKDSTIERSRDVARATARGARSAGSQLEDFLYDNPLAAGAIAVGIGAILGGLFPSTSIEDRYMGPARDEAMERARRVAGETLEHGKEAASRVADEAKHAAKDVAEKGKEEAKHFGEAARKSATEEARGEQKFGQGDAVKKSTGEQGTAQHSATSTGRGMGGSTHPSTGGERGGQDLSQRTAGEGTRDVRKSTSRGPEEEGRSATRTGERGATERSREGDAEDKPFGSSVK